MAADDGFYRFNWRDQLRFSCLPSSLVGLSAALLVCWAAFCMRAPSVVPLFFQWGSLWFYWWCLAWGRYSLLNGVGWEDGQAAVLRFHGSSD